MAGFQTCTLSCSSQIILKINLKNLHVITVSSAGIDVMLLSCCFLSSSFDLSVYDLFPGSPDWRELQKSAHEKKEKEKKKALSPSCCEVERAIDISKKKPPKP